MKFICLACGWAGDPTAPSRSLYRKKSGCSACGSTEVQPMAMRAALPRPDLLIQPPDKIVAKLLELVKE